MQEPEYRFDSDENNENISPMRSKIYSSSLASKQFNNESALDGEIRRRPKLGHGLVDISNTYDTQSHNSSSKSSPGLMDVSSKTVVDMHDSPSEVFIKEALSQTDPIGDFSVGHALPLVQGGRHKDLNSITHNTVSYIQVFDFALLATHCPNCVWFMDFNRKSLVYFRGTLEVITYSYYLTTR